MDALGSIAWHTRLDQGISDLCRKSPISFPPSDAATLIAAHASLLRLAGAQDGVPVFKLDVMPALTRLARVGIAIDRSDGHRVARRSSANLPTAQAMHYQSIPISIDHPRYPRLTGAVSKLAKPSRPRSRDEGRVSVAGNPSHGYRQSWRHSKLRFGRPSPRLFHRLSRVERHLGGVRQNAET
jgi:hypothetical protein